MRTNPYEILGVLPTATEEDIKAAFKSLAKDLHPDKPQGNAEQFKELQMAYETLIDPVKRKIYDETGVIDDMLTQLAVTDLKKLITSLSEQLQDSKELGTFDLIARIMTAVKNNLHKIDIGIAWLDAKIAHFESVRHELKTRIKKKTDKNSPDIFVSPLDKLIADNQVQKKNSANAKMVLNRIAELLAEYEYEFTAPPPPPMANGASNDNGFKVKLLHTITTPTGAVLDEGDVMSVKEKMDDDTVIAEHENGVIIHLQKEQFKFVDTVS